MLLKNYITYALKIKENINKNKQFDSEKEKDFNERTLAAYYIYKTTSMEPDQVNTAFPTLTSLQQNELKKDTPIFPPINEKNINSAKDLIAEIEKVNKESSSSQLLEDVSSSLVGIVTEAQAPTLQRAPAGASAAARDDIRSRNKALEEAHKKKQDAAKNYQRSSIVKKAGMIAAAGGYLLLNAASGGGLKDLATNVGVDPLKAIQAVGSTVEVDQQNAEKEQELINKINDAIAAKTKADEIAEQESAAEVGRIQSNYENALNNLVKSLQGALSNKDAEYRTRNQFIMAQLKVGEESNQQKKSESQMRYKMSCFSFLMQATLNFNVAFINLKDNEEFQQEIGSSIDYYTGKMEENRMRKVIDKYRSDLSSRGAHDATAAVPISVFRALLKLTLADPTLLMQRYEFVSGLLEKYSIYRGINGWKYDNNGPQNEKVNAFISQILQSFDRQAGYSNIAISSQLSPTQITILVFAVIDITETKITPMFSQIDYFTKKFQAVNTEVDVSTKTIGVSGYSLLTLLAALTGIDHLELIPYFDNSINSIVVALTTLFWNARSPVLNPSFDSEGYKSKFNQELKVILGGLYGDPERILQLCNEIGFDKPKTFYEIVSDYEKKVYNEITPALRQVIVASQIYNFAYRMVKFTSNEHKSLPEPITSCEGYDNKLDPVLETLLFKTVLKETGQPTVSFGLLNTGLENGLQYYQKVKILNTIINIKHAVWGLTDNEFSRIEETGQVGNEDFVEWLINNKGNFNIGAEINYETFTEELTAKYPDLLQGETFERNKMFAQLFIIYAGSETTFNEIATINENIVGLTNTFLEGKKETVEKQKKGQNQVMEPYINLGFQYGTFTSAMQIIILLLKSNLLLPFLMDKSKLMENHLKFFESTWAPAADDELLKKIDLSEFFTLQEGA